MKKNLLKIAAIAAIGVALSSQSQAQNWLLTGNAGTDTAINFVGTTNNIGLKIKTNNIDRVWVGTNGRVGIGTNAPVNNLDVVNNGSVTSGIRSITASATMSMDRGLATGNAAFAYKSLGTVLWNSGILGNDNFTIRNVVTGTSAMIITPANNVGIGTGAPTQKLDVNGNINSNGIIYAAGGNSTNWNAAYGWGNHAAAGYLTAETDPQVGVNTLNYVPSWNGSNLATSNIYSAGSFVGINTTSGIGAGNFIVKSPYTSGYGGMYVTQDGASRRPFYGYSLSGTPIAWHEYDETSGNWQLYNNGYNFVVSNTGNVGIGTTNPFHKFEVLGATSAFGQIKATSSWAGLVIDKATSTDNGYLVHRTGGADRWTEGTIGTDDFGIYNWTTYSQALTVNLSNNNVGIGTTAPTSKLDVSGDATSTSPVVNGQGNYSGYVDVVGVNGNSIASPGYGIGVYGTGGYMGVSGNANASTYTGTAYGVFGNASGSTAGTRIGVYGSSYGGSSSEANWGGYFPTKTYTNELRVGGTQGATGYVAAINGKLIAEEVRVELRASWPDYVFNSNYNMLSLNELEGYVKEYNHLPGVPSACDVENNGLMLGQMQSVMMEKTEENTLYILQLKKENDTLKNKLEKLQQQVETLLNK